MSRPGSALDGEAARRGNSVYFPDRVVPMLPEALSNDLCSLRPGEDRPCVAALLWIDSAGRKRRHRFERAVMRSAARLTYEAVQAAQDGSGGALPLAPERLDALYGAFAALDRARRARGALELDLAEHRVVLDDDGRPIAVVPRARLDSHRLIEEFMILANVAAAEELEARHQACMYRVHDAPDPEKLAALRDFLDEIGIPGLALAKGQVIRPELFNRILARAADTPEREVVNELVLRSQAQAVYSPNNIGHFGLALPRYAHFTSPIRRYADLLVHRALVAGGAPAREAGESSGRDRRAHLGDRAPSRGGRTQRARSLSRFLARRRDRHRVRGADNRGGFVRPVRDLARNRRRRAGPDIDAARRLLRPRCLAPSPRRPPHRPGLRARRRRERDPGGGGHDRRPHGVPPRRSFGSSQRRASSAS